jgi:chemotaxis signal transduction protein
MVFDATPVREILGARPWVALPRARPEVPGALPWRGRAVAVLDLGATLPGLARLDPESPRPRTLVVELGPNTIAIPVDGVREVREVDEDSLAPARKSFQAYASSEIEIDGALMPVIDWNAIVNAALGGSPQRPANRAEIA